MTFIATLGPNLQSQLELLVLSMQVGPRSGFIIGVKATHPPQAEHEICKDDLKSSVWKVFGGCLEGAWKVFED